MLKGSNSFTFLVGVLIVLLTVTACGSVETPVAEPTATETVEPTEAPPTEAPTATVAPTATEAPTMTPEPTPTLEPTVAGPLDANTMALYAAGVWDGLQLYELSNTLESEMMDQTVFRGTVVSSEGEWMAVPASPPAASGVVVWNLSANEAFTVTATTDFDVFGMAFDANEERLAVLELSGPGDGQSWAILVIDLMTESVTRFEGMDWQAEDALLPGFPVGWSSSGEWLLIDTFLPFTDAGPQGLWALGMPPGADAQSIEALTTQQLLPEGAYRSRPQLSPNATRISYLARDPDYTPENFEPVAFDFAVNQLWTLNLETEDAEPTMWLAIEDGGALAGATAWSPDGQRILIAEGTYDGDTFSALTLRTHNGDAFVEDVGHVPLPEGGSLVELGWCREDLALLVAADDVGNRELFAINMVDGAGTSIADAVAVTIVGCVDKGVAAD